MKKTILSIRRGRLKVDVMSVKTKSHLPRRKKRTAAAALLAAARGNEQIIVRSE